MLSNSQLIIGVIAENANQTLLSGNFIGSGNVPQRKICAVLRSIRSYFALTAHAVVFHLDFIEMIVLFDEFDYQAELA